MLDQLTVDQKYALATGCCPDCSNAEFLHGPIGGLARNYQCAACGAAFNLTIIGNPAQLAFAQRIPPLTVVDGFACGPLPAAGYDLEAAHEAAYHDPSYPERTCDYEPCGKTYTGASVYCSRACAIADA